MKPSCKNHTDKAAVVRGMCQACYMKERRAARKLPGEYTHRRTPTGETVAKVLMFWDHDMSEKFYARVDATAGKDACHPWRSTRNSGGYGILTLGGHNVLAHRMAHALATRETSAQVVMHMCDNPSCVNPRHLRGGTYADNTADMVAKAREGHRDGAHLKNRATHPRAKPVYTPHGAFPSASLAAEATGMHPRRVSRYCQMAIDGWSYTD